MPSKTYEQIALKLNPTYQCFINRRAEEEAEEAKNNPKGLSIKYIGCKPSEKEAKTVEVTFNVTAKNLKTDRATALVNGRRIPFISYFINPKGQKQITVPVPQNLITPKSKYTVTIVCDGVSADSEPFELECVSNSVKGNLRIWHYVHDGNEWGKYHLGHLNNQTAELLEIFAKTKEGYAFLSQYATKGQKIGSVEFKENGKYSNHSLNIIEQDQNSGSEGEFRHRAGKNNLEFDILLNVDPMNDNKDGLGKESYAIVIGHEAFLHMDNQAPQFIDAYNKGGKDAYNKLAQIRGRGEAEHTSYFKGTHPQLKKFNNYILQLKKFFNSTNIDKAKKSHDDSLRSHLRNK
ncbi:MAG: hypothetical protein LBH22_09170 [Bacteroidales bacterium]|jgi:hypothetical protein|nr:hypothetical protein [Bacteroidales bacterium]